MGGLHDARLATSFTISIAPGCSPEEIKREAPDVWRRHAERFIAQLALGELGAGAASLRSENALAT